MSLGAAYPVEPGDAAGECAEHLKAADLGGPGEEVRLDDALQAGLAAEVAAMEQVCGVGRREPANVDAEAGLHDHAYDGGQVGMADEEVVHLGGVVGDLSQGRSEEVLP